MSSASFPLDKAGELLPCSRVETQFHTNSLTASIILGFLASPDKISFTSASKLLNSFQKHILEQIILSPEFDMFGNFAQDGKVTSCFIRETTDSGLSFIVIFIYSCYNYKSLLFVFTLFFLFDFYSQFLRSSLSVSNLFLASKESTTPSNPPPVRIVPKQLLVSMLLLAAKHAEVAGIAWTQGNTELKEKTCSRSARSLMPKVDFCSLTKTWPRCSALKSQTKKP